MKIRNGFVSNSSSSSFIVASKKEPKIKIELTFDSFQEEFDTIEDYENHMVEEWCVKEFKDINEKWIIEEHAKVKQALKKGLKVFLGHTSSDDFDCPASFVLYGNPLPESKEYEVIRENEN